MIIYRVLEKKELKEENLVNLLYIQVHGTILTHKQYLYACIYVHIYTCM